MPIIAGCKTTKIERVIVYIPARPQRKEIQAPQSLQDYARILNYYESLVEEWETWADTVTQYLTNEQK